MKKLLSIVLTVVFVLGMIPLAANANVNPACVDMTMSGYRSTLYFDHVGTGLTTTNSTNSALDGFQVLSLGEWVEPDSAYIASSNTVVIEHSDTYSMVSYIGDTLCASNGAKADEFMRQAARTVSSQHINAAITSSGTDMYTPDSSSGYRYQYGASTIVNPDGSIDAWLSSTGSSASGP